jgi:hypothetical protein
MDNPIDFACKYPFSREAKEVVQTQGNDINLKYLEMGGKHVETATTGTLDYKDVNLNSVKLDYIMTYLYSRMILSCTKRSDLIKIYAMSEANRSSQAIERAAKDEIINVASQLGIRLTGVFAGSNSKILSDDFSISFVDYVKNAPRLPDYELVNQRLSNGIVLLNKNAVVKVIEQAMVKEIMKGLPIKTADLPKRVIDYTKNLKFRSLAKIETGTKGKTEDWIEKLLQTPIADVRHRTVNLILAPYLVNTKGLDVDVASNMIHDYIEKCKLIDPNTKINDNYIRYQCDYAKKRGLKPLSSDRAKELLGSQIDFEEKPKMQLKKV